MVTNTSPPQGMFWSTVTWPRQEGIIILVGGPLGFFVYGSLYGGLLYGAMAGATMRLVLAALWALHRVLKAWAEWPARHRWVSWLKAAVRYLLTDDA